MAFNTITAVFAAVWVGASISGAGAMTPPTVKPGLPPPPTSPIEDTEIPVDSSELDFDEFLDALDTDSVGSSGITDQTAVGSEIAPHRPAPLPGIGIAPGDIVLGNMSYEPGHAGIFIGRWRDLPDYIQSRYSHVLSDVIVRSGDWGLVDSYLVVDSIAEGVRLRSFTEQFTGYYPNNADSGILPDASQWESTSGGAIAWPGLSVDDPRRLAIVEEALQAAAAEIPYDLTFLQWASVFEQYAEIPYERFDVGMDCITLVHVAYYRGAGIDLDTSWLPYHAPGQIYEEALTNGYFRPVDLMHARHDALMTGRWRLSQTSLQVSGGQPISDELQALMSIEPAVYAFWPDGDSFYFSFPATLPVDQGMWETSGWTPRLERQPDGSAVFTITNANSSFSLTGRFSADGQLNVEVRGDIRGTQASAPLDVSGDGRPDASYLMTFTGEKVRGMPTPRLRRSQGLNVSAQQY